MLIFTDRYSYLQPGACAAREVGSMSNVAGKAYGMTVITPMNPARTWVNHLVFMASRMMPGTLSGLLGLSLIHFARWVIVRRDQWPDLGQGKPEVDNDH